MKKTPENNVLSTIAGAGIIHIEPVKQAVDITDTKRFIKVDSGVRMQLSALASQIPNAAAAASMSGMYTVKFPQGVTGALTKLKQGGYGSMLKGNDGRFVGHASFFQDTAAAVVFGAFTAMAVVSQQYFLAQINKELKLINQKIDKILGFLYGNKKAELLSEICFIKRAIRDYTSIMEHESQQSATLTAIIQSEKVAMKDIEFYLLDLNNTVQTELSGSKVISQTYSAALQICESLNASLQLYIMSCILEVYYSQNTNKTFIENLKADLSMYVGKCHNRMTNYISTLHGKVEAYKATFDTIDKEPILKKLDEIIESHQEGHTIEMQKSLSDALDTVTKEVTFIVANNEDVYYKVS